VHGQKKKNHTPRGGRKKIRARRKSPPPSLFLMVDPLGILNQQLDSIFDSIAQLVNKPGGCLLKVEIKQHKYNHEHEIHRVVISVDALSAYAPPL